jgi:hypothetical protein
MDNEPVYVTFEFNGNLAGEVEKVTLGIKGLRDESALSFKRLLQGGNEAFASMSKESQLMAVAVEKDIVALRQLELAQAALDALYKEGKIALDAYVEARARLAAGAGELQEKIAVQTRAIAEQNQALRGLGSASGISTAGFNTLNFSVQQVARELPSVTMGAHMFFLAISNNLPILSDNIQKARTEYAALTAAGQKATPVWKQILSSITSWQTAMVVGITLLVMYGKEIGAWASSLFKGAAAADHAAQRQKAFNEATEKAYNELGDKIVLIKKLSEAWVALGGDVDEQKKFIAENKGEFDKLDVSVRSVAEAENLLIDNVGAFVDAMKLKAQAAAASSLAAEEYEKEMRLRKKAEDERINARLPWMQRQATFLNPSYDAALEQRRTADYGDELAAGIHKEADAAKEAAEAYFKLSEAKEKEAAAALASAGISSKDAGDDAPERNRARAALDDSLREIQKMQEKIRQGALDAEMKLREEEIRLMYEGLSKTLARIDLDYDRQIAEIAKKGEELVRERQEVERKTWEAAHPKWREEGLAPPVGTASVKDLPQDVRRGMEDRVFLAGEQRLKDITRAEKEAAGEIEKIWEETSRRFLSGLEAELAGIDRFYDEKIKKARQAGATEEQILELIALREKEKNAARSKNATNTALERIDLEQDAAQKILDAREKGDVLYLIKKNSLEKKYAQMRLNILKKAEKEASGERAKQIQGEALLLEAELKRLDGQGKELQRELAKDLLSPLSEIVSVIGEMNSGLEETAHRTEEIISVAQQLISKNYLGAAITVISSAISSLARENARAVAEAKEIEAAYWDAVNYKIERQIELMKELQGIGREQVGESIQEEIDTLLDRLWNFDLKLDDQGEGRRYMNNVLAAAASATDEFTKGVLYKLAELDRIDIEVSLFGKKTYLAYDDLLSGLTTEELISLQTIPEIWSLLPAEVQEYIIKLSDAVDKQKELKEYTDELYTATTRNAIADAIIEGFAQGKRSAEDFAGDFEGMMKDAILQSIKTTALNEPLRAWYELFSAYAADGLTEEEIAELRRMYNEIIAAAAGQFDYLEDVTGIDLQDTIRSASQKGIASISQDSADALDGKFTTMLYYQDKIHTAMIEIHAIIASMLTLMGEIAVNTAYCRHLEAIDRHMEKMSTDVATIARDGTYIKK